MNQKSLIVFRALQGATIGIAYPQTIVLIAVMFPKNKQSFCQRLCNRVYGYSYGFRNSTWRVVCKHNRMEIDLFHQCSYWAFELIIDLAELCLQRAQ